MFIQVLRYAKITINFFATLYRGILGLLTTSWFQAHVVSIYAIQVTWLKGLDILEFFGFLYNQVTQFEIASPGGGSMYA
ncbi:hypothetical protein BST61_g11616 [Cercospora zeina]